MQSFNDTLKRLREDFFLWRNRPSNKLGATLVMTAILLAVSIFVFKRLWKTRRRLEEVKRSNGYAGTLRRTPLNSLEKQAEKLLGPRPVGKPFAQWISLLKPGFTDSKLLDEAVDLHQRVRFDPAPVEPAAETRLEELAKDIESTLKRK